MRGGNVCKVGRAIKSTFRKTRPIVAFHSACLRRASRNAVGYWIRPNAMIAFVRRVTPDSLRNFWSESHTLTAATVIASACA
jgi:hypothetical protein